MRGFLALELPEALRTRLAGVQEALRKSCPDERVRWVAPENMHVTAKFLGEVQDPEAVLAAIRSLQPPVPLELSVHRLGVFGGKRPRVVWAGLRGEGLPTLTGVIHAVEAVLEPLGFEPESRAYSPHVTLGRPRQRGRKGPPSKLPQALAQVTFEPCPFTASALTLFKSSAGESGAPVHYEAIGRWDFATLR